MAKPERIDEHLDCRGMSCPLPILKTKKKITGMASGQVIEVISTDPGSVADFKGWSSQTGHSILYNEQNGKDYIYYIQKT